MNRLPKFLPLKKSRSEIKAGDIFVYKISTHPKVFGVGRVVHPKADWTGEKVPLICLYKVFVQNLGELPNEFTKSKILFGPCFVTPYN